MHVQPHLVTCLSILSLKPFMKQHFVSSCMLLHGLYQRTQCKKRKLLPSVLWPHLEAEVFLEQMFLLQNGTFWGLQIARSSNHMRNSQPFAVMANVLGGEKLLSCRSRSVMQAYISREQDRTCYDSCKFDETGRDLSQIFTGNR